MDHRIASFTVPSLEVQKAIDRYIAKTRPAVKPGDLINLKIDLQARPPDNSDLARILSEVVMRKLKENGCSLSTSADVTMQVTLIDKDLGRPLMFGVPFEERKIPVPNRELELTYAFVNRSGRELWSCRQSARVGPMTVDDGGDIATKLLNRRWEMLVHQLPELDLAPTVYIWGDSGIGTSTMSLQGEEAAFLAEFR